LELRWKLLRQRLYAVIVPGERIVTIEKTKDGVAFHVDRAVIHGPSPWRWKLYRRGWPARLDRLEKEYGVGRHFHLSETSMVFDVGANAGEFAHVCARYGARVICFEPDPAAHAALLKNIETLSSATAQKLAIWNKTGVIDFGLAPDRADSSAFVDDNVISAPASTIEDFCRETGTQKIDLVKCDAEGAEPEVLEGVGGCFDRIGGFALDTGAERMGRRTHEACSEILQRAGFRVVQEQIGKRWMTYGLRA
jgi:FkbM family methyltransferase